MRTFPCNCENQLFFLSTACVRCGADTGMCPVCRRVVPLTAEANGDIRCGNTECGRLLRRCRNFSDEQTCNRCIDHAREPDETQCDYCRLTTVIPDLSVEGNRDKWRRLERAKHRVLFVVDEIGLPIRPSGRQDEPQLSFEFKADGAVPVHTGHHFGCITINLREADHVEREKARVALQEPQRTLVGHFRHELGHYFWDRLVKNDCLDEWRSLFGDERDPEYGEALKDYYANGPAANWNESFITAYGSMHPWEDFAETFGAYLDIVSVIETAYHFGYADESIQEFDPMLATYQQIGLIANEFNRDMGLLDLVPEVFVPAVVEKLRFIHSLRSRVAPPSGTDDSVPPA